MRRTVLALALGGTLVALVLPAAAQPALPKPVVVNSGNAVGVGVNNSDGSPLVGAVIQKDGSDACVGISYQMPICLNR